MDIAEGLPCACQVAWYAWLAGTALIVGSWAGLVSPTAGWAGFAVSGVAALITWLPGRADRSQYPLTWEGLPVEPSGVPVPHDMELASGTPLLAHSQGQWWRATVVSVEEDGDVVVTFPGWDASWTQRLPRKSLQVDPDPNRMPIKLPEGPFPRWREGPPSEDIRGAGPQRGVQR